MPEIKKINTLKYTTEGQVEVDGKLWTIVLPGAGDELKLSKMQRRGKFLGDKIDSGNYTEEDLDKYDEIEEYMFNFFKTIFKDGTEDNSEVNEWVYKTPMSVIIQAFEDIKSQAEESDLASD
jgi:hypothetical protein